MAKSIIKNFKWLYHEDFGFTKKIYFKSKNELVTIGFPFERETFDHRKLYFVLKPVKRGSMYMYREIYIQHFNLVYFYEQRMFDTGIKLSVIGNSKHITSPLIVPIYFRRNIFKNELENLLDAILKKVYPSIEYRRTGIFVDKDINNKLNNNFIDSGLLDKHFFKIRRLNKVRYRIDIMNHPLLDLELRIPCDTTDNIIHNVLLEDIEKLSEEYFKEKIQYHLDFYSKENELLKIL